MLKKCFLASCLLLASQLANASAMPSSSFYIAPTLAVPSISGTGASATAVQAKFALGYGGAVWPFIYMGGEIFGSINGYTASNFPSPFGSLRTCKSIGFSFLPGYMLDDVLTLYFRAGLIWTQFSSFNSTRQGYQLGVGLTYEINCNWDVRGEYIYARYKDLDGLGQPKVNEGDIGLVYHFG